MIRNLGQVAAIYIGSSAPRNTNLIWLDNTVVPFVFRAYDGSAWSEIATHKWVRAYVDGWLVTLPPRQLADDGDYMLINSNNVNYKITVKDFVKSAVGNPLDFKGVIRVSADFPNPSTLESGDMYVIITSPAGGTVTDPYSGKTFEDSEKIVWDEVTQSWESLGKIDITVDLTTSYSETEVTIHSSAGKETTIQGATDQLAGVMLPGQYSWLQALSNGSIVPGDPSPLTPLTPAHKHNYNDIINRLVSQQGTGESTIDPMSQKATTDALNLKFDKASVLQVSGAATDKVMSQKAVTDALKTLSDDFNNKLTNYLPLAGGTMKGSIIFPNRKGIFGRLTDGTGNIKIAVVNANNNVEIGNSNTPLMLVSNSTDLTHYRDNNTYKIWDKFNLSDPATLSGNNTFTGNNTFQAGKFNVGPFEVTSSGSLLSNISSPAGSSWGRSLVFRANNDIPSSIVFGGYNSVDDTSIGYVYIGIGDVDHSTAQYKFYADKSAVPTVWSLTDGINDAITLINSYTTFGRKSTPLRLRGNNTNLIHIKDSTGYIIWDESNLPNPVTYIVDENNHATLKNKNGQYFTYIKAGTNGLLPHSKATLVSGGSGSLGTSDQSFNAAYINNLHTNKISFGETGPYITGSTSATQFLNAEGGVQKVATGGLYVGPSYASDALNLVPVSGIYSQGNIRTSGWLTFEDNEWTDTGWAYKEAKGSIKVLSVIDKANNKPTSYGSVLQFNSRVGHWCTQIWCDQTNVAGVIGTLRFRTTKSHNSTEWNPWTALVTEFDLNSYLTKTEASTFYLPLSGGTISSSKSNPLIINSTHVSQSSINFNRGGVNKGTVGFYENLGSFLQNATGETLAVKSDGAYYGVNNNSLRKLATVTDLNNYLPLTGGTLNTASSIVLSLNSAAGVETCMRVLRNGTPSAAIGFMDSLGAYIYNYNSNKYLFIADDGYARVGTTSGSTRLALITDIPTVSGYLPLSGGTLTGTLKINSGGSEPLVINNSASAGEAYVVTKTQGTTRGVMGWNSSLGMFLQDSRGYTFSMKADGVYFGASSSTLTKLPTSTDLSGYLPLAGGTLTGALTMSSRRHGVVIDVIGGAGNTWDEGVGALSVQVPNDTGQTPLLLARRSGAAIDTTTAAERLLSMELLDDGHSFIIGMSGSKALQLDWTSGKAGTGKLFGKTIATTDQIPSIPSISISNSGTGNAVTSITANGHTLTVTKGATYLTSHQTIYNLTFQAGTFSAKTFDPNGAAATVNIPTNTSHLTNDSGFITSSALNGYATQSWVNSQNFVKSTSTKKVTDIQPVDALPATQVSGVLYLVFG